MTAAAQDRIEDLEEALRLIVCLLQPASRHLPTDRDWAVLAVTCDQLDIDLPSDSKALLALTATK